MKCVSFIRKTRLIHLRAVADTHTHIHTHTNTHTQTHTRSHKHTHTHTHAHSHYVCKHTNKHTHTHSYAEQRTSRVATERRRCRLKKYFWVPFTDLLREWDQQISPKSGGSELSSPQPLVEWCLLHMCVCVCACVCVYLCRCSRARRYTGKRKIMFGFESPRACLCIYVCACRCVCARARDSAFESEYV